MTHLFSQATSDLLNDAAVNAIDAARGAGMPDHAIRPLFLATAGAAFDAIAADQEDADPEAQRQEFLG